MEPTNILVYGERLGELLVAMERSNASRQTAPPTELDLAEVVPLFRSVSPRWFPASASGRAGKFVDMKNNSIIKVMALALVGVVAAVSLSACEASSYVGPTNAPKVVVASSEDPTSDLLTSYRRSITVGSGSELYDTFSNADALAESSGAHLLSVVFSQAWYDGIALISGKNRAESAATYVLGYVPDTGSAFRLCNAVFVDASIPTPGRQAIYDAVTNFEDQSSSPEPGAKYQYRVYSADPGNELLTYADACA